MPESVSLTNTATTVETAQTTGFSLINRGYRHTFRRGRLTLGLVVPLESYPDSPVPQMQDHLQRIQLAEQLGFSAVWLRDVPFNVPEFGDAGNLFDPFVYLGFLAAQTRTISLGVASIVLPLRHPAHVAKAAASADVLSGGRVILGVASGDRPDEYPAMNQVYDNRGLRFRESYHYIQQMWQQNPAFENYYGNSNGHIDMLPKPAEGRLPLLVTGASQQNPDWIAQHADGWMLYPRAAEIQQEIISSWQHKVALAGRPVQPVMQPLYVDLTSDDNALPQPIHLGFRLGINRLREHLHTLEAIGINHVALNLRFNQAGTEATLEKLASQLLPEFSTDSINP